MIGVPACLIEVVQNRHHGAAAIPVEVTAEVEELYLKSNVKERGRLVEQHERRVLREYERHPDTLALTTGEPVHSFAGQVFDAGGGHRRGHRQQPRPILAKGEQGDRRIGEARPGEQFVHRSRRRQLAQLGPLLVPFTVLVWAALLWLGFTLVFLPWSPAESGFPGWFTALYVSGYSVTTLGTGDITPSGRWPRALMVLAAASERSKPR